MHCSGQLVQLVARISWAYDMAKKLTSEDDLRADHRGNQDFMPTEIRISCMNKDAHIRVVYLLRPLPCVATPMQQAF
ncbi:MAG: hypothetical protein DMG09_26720 [Acidobacteria bacterium]|nr:MAG: hypothetical protein DMG09_26720 [Acidobacteriota bacterium]